MPVNKARYFYINRVGVLLNSWTHQRLVQDAIDSHMPEQHGKLVAMRLADYYRLQDRINQLFRYNPAMAAMLLSVGGGASEDDEPLEELHPRSTAAHTNGKKPGTRSAVSATKTAKPPQQDEEDEEEEGAAAPEGNELLDDTDDQWKDL